MNERTIIKLIVGSLLVTLCAWGINWFFSNYERVNREVVTGYSQEALRNPFLAAHRFLDHFGANVSSVSLSELWRTKLQPGDVVVFHRFLYPRGATRQRQLREWLESGGHLIIDADALPEEDDEVADDLFAELGVRAEYLGFSDSPDEETTISIKFAGFDDAVTVEMTPQRYLIDSEELAVAAVPLEDGFGLLQYEVGDGYLTVLADNDFLSNRHIGKGEHALALALLVGLDHSERIWLVHDISMPPLTTLLWDHAPQAIIAGTIAVLLWLWSLTVRLGPQLQPLQQPRRDLGEHLSASAQYLWGLDRCTALLALNRQTIEQAWLTKHYVLRNMSQQERCEWIAARAGLSAAIVERALYSGQGSENEFIELSSYLQILRATL